MLKQKSTTKITTSSTLTYAQMGEIVFDSASNRNITLPAPNIGLWYRITNVSEGTVYATITYSGTEYGDLHSGGQAYILANSTTGYYVTILEPVVSETLQTATITTSWIGTVAPYTQTINLGYDITQPSPKICAVYSGTNANKILQKKAWNMISEINANASNNTLLITCFEKKPTIPIDIQIGG